MREAYPRRATEPPGGEGVYSKSGMAAAAAVGRSCPRRYDRLPPYPSRAPQGAAGSRELLSMLCEALAVELRASDCLVSRVDDERGMTVDVAGFTRTPDRWHAAALEYPLGRLSGHRGRAPGRAALHHLGGRSGRRSGRARAHAVDRRQRRAGAAVVAPGRVLLVEVWSDERRSAFGRRDIRRASRLVARASRLLPEAGERDREQERRFLRAAGQARQIGAADPALVPMAESIGERLRMDEPALRQLRLVALVHEAGRSRDPAAAAREAHAADAGRVGGGAAAYPDRPADAGPDALSARGGGRRRRHPRALERRRIPARASPASRSRWRRASWPCCAGYRAMRRGRGDSPPLDHDQALAELERAAGSQFDPAAVAAAMRCDRPRRRPAHRAASRGDDLS